MTELEQQYKDQVDKLTARLQKAAEVFKTQKADIERVRAERDEAQAECTKLQNKLKEFEERINTNSNIEGEMMKQTEEMTRLENDLVASKNEVKELTSKLESTRIELTETDNALEKIRSAVGEAIVSIAEGMKTVSTNIVKLNSFISPEHTAQ